MVQGDGLFHLARVRKLLQLDALSLDRVSEFADGSLHPGYAFPLWHGFLALIAKVAHEDPERVVTHLPSILAPLAVVIAFEAGWALFRRTWAAGATAGAQVAMICFAPGMGGAYVFLALPATASRQLLVPAALALALESVRSPSVGGVLSTAAAGLVLAVVHPTYAIFLWIPFVGFLAVRLLWTRADLRTGALALAALVAPAGLFMLWLRPDRERHPLGLARCPGASAGLRAVRQPARRPLRHVVQPRRRGVHTFGRGGDRGTAAGPGRVSRGPPAVGGVRRRRLTRGVRGHAASVPVHVPRGSRLDLAGTPRGGLPAFRLRVRRRDGRARTSRRADPAPIDARGGDVPADRLSGRLRVRPQGARPGVDHLAVVRGGAGGARRRGAPTEAGDRGRRCARVGGVPPAGRRRRASRPPADAASRGRDALGRARGRGARGRSEGGRGLLRSRDELPPCRVRAGVHRVGAARSRGRHGEEQPLRARERRAPLPPYRRPRRYRAAMAPTTSSSTGSGRSSCSIFPSSTGTTGSSSTGSSREAPSPRRRASRRGGGLRG